MHCFLRNYQATPHATTDKTPAELLLGRALKTRVPEIIPSSSDIKVQTRDRKQKEKMKYYADSRRNAKDRNLKIGDGVLVKQPKQNKLSTPYSPEFYQIIKQKGSMITVKNDDEKEITRNSSFFKKIETVDTNTSDDKTETSDDPVSEEPITYQQEPRRSNRDRRPPAYLND